MRSSIFLLFPMVIFAYSYHGAYLLDGYAPPPNISAIAMGGMTVLPPRDAGNALWSPALLPGGGANISVFFRATNAEENRQLPLFDSFDDLVGWTAYASTIKTYPCLSASASYAFERDWLPTLGISWSRVFDARYVYREQVRERSGAGADRLIGVWSIDSDGGLFGSSIAVSEKILNYGHIGLSATFLSGNLEMRRSPAIGDSATNNAEAWEIVFANDTIYEADLSGTLLNAQIVATPTDRWQIGIRYSPKVELQKTLYPDLLPSRLGIGLGYRPSGYVPSRIVAEAELVRWSELADADSAYAVLSDAWEFRIGLEHKIRHNFPFRIGAYYRKLPLPETVSRVGFTVGGGKKFGIVTVDFSAGYETSEWRHHDQFPESWLPGTIPDRTDMDRVQETVLNGALGISIEF